jgi:hypothetical protein
MLTETYQPRRRLPISGSLTYLISTHGRYSHSGRRRQVKHAVTNCRIKAHTHTHTHICCDVSPRAWLIPHSATIRKVTEALKAIKTTVRARCRTDQNESCPPTKRGRFKYQDLPACSLLCKVKTSAWFAGISCLLVPKWTVAGTVILVRTWGGWSDRGLVKAAQRGAS